MTLKGGTSQACAACKYQRRRCTSECPLAPYFPPDQPKLFQNAHKLFGVSNILKILKKLEPEQKATAMWSIIYQANERERDPVHGCLGKICQLRYQIWHMEQELLSIHSRLEMLRQQQQQQQVIPSQLELVMGPPSNTVVDTALIHQESYNNNNNDTNNIVYDNALVVEGGSNDINPMWVQYTSYGTNSDNNHNNNGTNDDVVGVQFGIPTLHHQPLDLIQQDHQVVQDYDEMPFFDTMDDRQSYIDSKEAYDSSSEESVLKETNQTIDHLVDNELKNAAACLSLTSVN